jgi:hypothetical protein
LIQVRWVFFVVTLFTADTCACAQDSLTSIAGVVSDQDGSLIPGANVFAVERATGAEFRSVTSIAGRFLLGPLPAGDYRVEVYAPGFKQFIGEDVLVTDKQQLELNPKLELGSILEIGKLSTSISVTAEPALLPIDTPSVIQTIGSRYINQLPLNGRSPYVLAELAEGLFQTSDTTVVHSDDNGPESNFVISGSPSNQNTFLIDGSDNTQVTTGQVAYAPPQDSIKQVSVQVSNLDAALGHSGPGVVEVITKGGTNILHGALFEYNQVSALDANTWLNDSTGKPKPVTRQNQFGASSGGPFLIPRVYNGANRLFWYFSYEGLRNNAPQSSSLTVPTAPERTGNFSALLALGTQYQIYNPFTGVLGGSTITRQPFANNMIPASLISQIARNILNYYPLPNQVGLPNGQRNFTAAGEQSSTSNAEIGRLDYTLTARNRISWSARHDLRGGLDSDWFQNAASGRFDDRENWGTTLGDIVTFSPTMILDAHLNLTRFVDQQSYGNGSAFNFTQLGFSTSLGASSARPAFPVISAVGYTPLGSTAAGAGSITPEDSLQFFTGLTKVLTLHNIRAGVDLRQYRQGSQPYGYSSGEYTFNSLWTNGPTTTAAASPIGQSLAALLLGLPTGGEFDKNAEGVYRQDYAAFYFADDWRVMSHLTLSLGLRYDHDFPTTERLNRNVNGFEVNSPNPIQSAVQAAYAKSPISGLSVAAFATPGALTFASTGDRAIYHDRSHVFSPRLGFAWTPKSQPKTVVRGGFGIFTYPVPITGINQAGLSLVTPVTATLNNYVAPYAMLSNPFPGGLQQPVALNTATGLGTRVSFTNPNLLNPYTLLWNLDLVRQFGATLVVEAGYQGSHTNHLPENQQLDFTPLAYLSTTPTRNQAVINLLSTPVTNPFKGLFPNSTASLNSATSTNLQQLLQRYPEYTGVTEIGVNDASSYYESGFVRIEKRFSTGLQFLAVYTHARLMSRTLRLNPETALIDMVSPQDYPNRLVFSGTYQLPFGKGNTIGASAGRYWNGVIGGWLISTIVTYQTGAPLNWGNVIYLGGPLDLSPHNPQHTFNTAVFDTVSADQLADNWRTLPQYFSNLRADSIKNDDLSVSKTFQIPERMSLQFRFDFYNLFNHPVFATPGLNPTSPTFGIISAGTANRARVIQLGARVIW